MSIVRFPLLSPKHVTGTVAVAVTPIKSNGSILYACVSTKQPVSKSVIRKVYEPTVFKSNVADVAVELTKVPVLLPIGNNS